MKRLLKSIQQKLKKQKLNKWVENRHEDYDSELKGFKHEKSKKN